MDVAYLEIQVSQNTFLIPIASTQEVLNVAASLVVPVANMPKSVLGLLNHRSRVYWTLDLSEVLKLSTPSGLGDSSVANLAKYPIALMAVKDEVMAIAAEKINGIHKLSAPTQPLDAETPKNLRPYLEGYIDNIGVLNADALLKSVSS